MVKTQMLKDYLVGLGPDNAMLRTILRLNACVRGYQVRFCDRSIVLLGLNRIKELIEAPHHSGYLNIMSLA